MAMKDEVLDLMVEMFNSVESIKPDTTTRDKMTLVVRYLQDNGFNIVRGQAK